MGWPAYDSYGQLQNKKLTTPNKAGSRREQKSVSLILIHYTGAPTVKGTLSWFQNPASSVSAHHVIDTNGEIYSFEDWSANLWHAGESTWNSRRYCNSYSVGIELVGTGEVIHYGSTEAFTKQQYDSLVDVCHQIMDACPINSIVGHEHVAPGRKMDPGKNFDWDRFHQMLSSSFMPPSLEWFGGKRMED